MTKETSIVCVMHRWAPYDLSKKHYTKLPRERDLETLILRNVICYSPWHDSYLG